MRTAVVTLSTCLVLFFSRFRRPDRIRNGPVSAAPGSSTPSKSDVHLEQDQQRNLGD